MEASLIEKSASSQPDPIYKFLVPKRKGRITECIGKSTKDSKWLFSVEEAVYLMEKVILFDFLI